MLNGTGGSTHSGAFSSLDTEKSTPVDIPVTLSGTRCSALGVLAALGDGPA
jgi:hypothetical protein